MPTYEFRCRAGHATDRFYRTMTGIPAEIECPVCGASAERQMSAGAGLHFKGSGFYITDYGKDGKKPQPTTAAASDKAADKPSDKPGDKASSGEGGAKAEKSESSPSKTGSSKTGSSKTGSSASGGKSEPAPSSQKPSKE